MMIRLLSLGLLLLLSGCATQERAAAPQVAGTVAVAVPELTTQARKEDSKRERAIMMADYLLKMEADENGPPSAGQILRAVRQRDAIVHEGRQLAKLAGITPAGWQALGPGNIGGRIRALAIDPRNASRILAGAAGGGLWLTLDAGASWSPLNDFLGSLTISTLVFDPGNPDIVYAGTGEWSAGLVGIGIFKSTDSGLTWTWLANTSPDANADWRFVNRIAVHPQQGNVLLAGTTNGGNSRNGAIYRSNDSGQSWSRVSTAKAGDVSFDPNDPQNAVAGREDGYVSYSRDSGQSWQATQLIVTPSGQAGTARAEIAFAKTRAGLVFASIDNNKGEIWKSGDAGATWTLLSNPQHLNDQGAYANALWVDPGDENHLLAAGLDIYQSRDGGGSFNKVSDWRFAPSSPHADHHALVSVPGFGASNPAMYFANDGGVYRAGNIYSVSSASSANGWSSLNNGLAVTQFYGGAGKSAAGGKIIGGTQDTGSLIYSQGTDWIRYAGGDGGFSAVDPQSDITLYGEYVYLALHRSQNGGARYAYICKGITEGLPDDSTSNYCGANATKKSNFIAPFILAPNNPDRLLAGANSLWASNNAKASAPTWTKIKDPLGGDSGINYINAIAVAEGNPAIIWVGHNGGQVFKTTGGMSAVPVWQAMSGLPARIVQRILIDRDDANHVIVAYTGFVANNLWQTRDGGTTWASITGNLPQAPIFTVVRHPVNPNWLYVGTSVGVFASEDGGSTWSASNDGPSTVRVRELFWYSNNQLMAATYGRGMYRATVAEGGAANYQGVWWAGVSENGWGLSLVQHGNTLAAGWYYYGSAGQPTWTIMAGCNWNTSFTSCTGNLYNSTGAWLGDYTAASFVQNPVGTATFTFSDTNNGTLQYTVNGVSGTKIISQLIFASGIAPNSTNYTDIWWGGPSQNGWGVALFQQQTVMAGAWYTYDKQGQAVWYLINGGSWSNATTYSGQLTHATGSPLLGVNYNMAAFTPIIVGTVTITFTDANNAAMNYTVDGVNQTRAISRLAF